MFKKLIYRHYFSVNTLSQQQKNKKVFISTPIFYTNNKPHIGHLYTLILSDAYTRWLKIRGYDVIFSTGTDEHGIKIQQQAEKQEKDVQLFCDENSQNFKELAKLFNIQYDDFIRTTEPRHKSFVQSVFKQLQENNYIVKGKYTGLYSQREECYVNQKDITVDNEGNQIYKLNGEKLLKVDEENHMFLIQKLKGELLTYLNSKDIIQPSYHVNQLLDSLNDIKDLSFSRNSNKVYWGIKVPEDEQFTIYVWLDALCNYLTVIKSKFEQQEFTEYQQNMIHIMGKDIVKFHAIYWPAILRALKLETPKKILAHDHWLFQGEKMSKSLGNVVDPFNLIKNYEIDTLRLYFLSEGPQNFDVIFSEEVIKKQHNLFVDNFANMIQRMINPKFKFDEINQTQEIQLSESQQTFIRQFNETTNQIQQQMDNCDFRGAYQNIHLQFISVNRFIDHEKPWSLDKKMQIVVIKIVLECIRIQMVLLYPIIPNYIEKILSISNMSSDWQKQNLQINLREGLRLNSELKKQIYMNKFKL